MAAIILSERYNFSSAIARLIYLDAIWLKIEEEWALSQAEMTIRGFESEILYIGNLMSVKAQMRFYRAVMKKNGQRSMLVRLETHYMNLVN